MLDAKDLITRVLALTGGQPIRGAQFGQLARRVEPLFSLTAVGAPSMRAFLRAHDDLVQINHDGFDLLVSAQRPKALPAETTEQRPPLIRRDVWRAFTFVAPNLARFYRNSDGTIVTLPTQESSQVDATTHIPIIPISETEHRGFAYQFVDALPADSQKPFRDTLDQPFWFRDFTSLIRRESDLQTLWHKRRTIWVWQRIKKWADDNTVEISSLIGSRDPKPVEPRPVVSSSTKSDSARQRVLRAIERMPLGDLLALPIPAQYWLESE